MALEASNRTAALAGAWSAIGLMGFDAAVAPQTGGSVFMSNLVWLLAVAAFLFLPGIFLVVGRDGASFSRQWMDDPAERARYVALVKRIVVWLATAGAAWLVWHVALRPLFG